MSNKSSAFKQKKGGIQIGNFLVSFGNGQLQSVKISAVSGNWNIRFREDHPLFLWISNQIKTEEGRKILNLVFAADYAVCNGIPDNIFLEEIIQSYNNSIKRLRKAQGQSADQDDKQIVEEERRNYVKPK